MGTTTQQEGAYPPPCRVEIGTKAWWGGLGPPHHIEMAMTRRGGGMPLLTHIGQERHEEGHTPLVVCHGSVSFV